MGYKLNLKVSTAEGKRIIANVEKNGSLIYITIPFLELVKQDMPVFARNGVIKINTTKNNYPKVIEKLTSYLENLFLKGLNNESISSSIGIGNVLRGVKAKNSKRKVKSIKRKGNITSIYPGARRDKQTASDRGRDISVKLDKKDNSELSTKD